MSDESLSYDILIIGAGPAGLATAITIKKEQPDISVAILEKGSEVGAHILSGAVIETNALKKLSPEFESHIQHSKVTKDKFLLLGKSLKLPLPIPKSISNSKNIIISLGKLCKHLADIATELGVEILTSISGSKIIYENNNVIGVTTNEFGLDKNGEKLPNYQPGINLYAKQTVIAEGCRGYLAEQLIEKFTLRKNIQTYGLGIKELWKVQKNEEGLVIHTLGYPLGKKAYGGGFVYHLYDNQIAIGLITGLDYKNPYLDPFKEMQQFKTHPYIKSMLKNGKRINYGAKTISEGGYQSIPNLSFPGGLIVGDSAGFVNVPKIKGTNNALSSGIIAGQEIAKKYLEDNIKSYDENIRKAAFVKELKKVRNIRPSFKFGMSFGLLYSGINLLLFKGKEPWTFKHRHDRAALDAAKKYQIINYPKPDNSLTFDKANSLFLSGTMHRENEPAHLILKDNTLALSLNKKIYESPETRYCPAEVYEIVYNNNKGNMFQINAQNCLHCKACDIKDPTKNIIWTTPEGGDGPNYMNM